MPHEPDPTRAAQLLARLESLREVVVAAEEDVLASLVVTGEPHAQRVVDDWLDQVADTLRALGEAADTIAPVVARRAGTTSDRPAAARHDSRAGEPPAGTDSVTPGGVAPSPESAR